MNNKNPADVLRKLAKEDGARTKIARLRDVFPEIEAALAAGVSRQKIVECLAETGLIMTTKTFATMLYRLRQKFHTLSKSEATTPPVLASTTKQSFQIFSPEISAAQKGSEIVENTTLKPSTDPKDLDAIMRGIPDMAALAKIGKERRKKK